MINSSQIQINVLTYLRALEHNYQQLQNKKREIEALLHRSARKIQAMFRSYSLSKKTRAAIKIQRAWKTFKVRQVSIRGRVQKFRRLYYGLVISSFVLRTMKIRVAIQPHCIPKCRHLRRVSQHFCHTINKKSALIAQNWYISKYRSYLHNNFNEQWGKYEKQVKKQLWGAVKKKWVRVPGRPNIYLNQFDKEVDAQKYIEDKLEKIYEHNHRKVESNRQSLNSAHEQIQRLLMYEHQRYIKAVMNS